MVTIRDVAKDAGVSHGTVSNVLNKRGIVSPEKIKQVQEAIRKLGYTPHATARSLKTRCSMNIGVILPNVTDPNFAHIFTGIERVLSERGYTIALYSTAEIPAKESLIIDRICQQRLDGVIIITCQPKKPTNFRAFEHARVKTVFVERDVNTPEINYLGYDNYASLYGVTAKLLQGQHEQVFLLTGPAEYSSEAECIRGFRDAHANAGKRCDDARILETHGNKESAFKTAVHLLRGIRPPATIITSSRPILEGSLKAIALLEGTMQDSLRIVTLSEDNWADSAIPTIWKIPRKAIQLGESAAETLLENITHPVIFDYVHRVMKNGPLETHEPQEQRHASRIGTGTTHPLRILMPNNSASKATAALLPDFIRKTGIPAVIETSAIEYDRQYAAVIENRTVYDVFQVDLPWFPDLADAGYLADLSAFIEKYPDVISDYIPGVLETYSRHDNGYFALPYSFATQLLFYRKDLFDDPEIRQNFEKHSHSELHPPRTWKEFNVVAKFFTRAYTPESPVEYGTTLGGAPDGVVCEFLSRQWAYGGNTFDESGNLVLNSKETLRALRNYVESYNYAPAASVDYWWDEQVEEFRQGKAAMMVMFMVGASTLTDRSKSKILGNIGYTIIPGGNPVLGGWSLAINSGSSRKEDAFRFISWATSRDLAIPHTILGGATPSIHLYKSSELLTIYPWLPKALESFAISRKRVVSKQALGRTLTEREYEKILADAIRKAITQQLSPEAAIRVATEGIEQFLKNDPGWRR